MLEFDERWGQKSVDQIPRILGGLHHLDTNFSTDLTTSDGRFPKTLAKLNNAFRDGLFSPRSSWPM